MSGSLGAELWALKNGLLNNNITAQKLMKKPGGRGYEEEDTKEEDMRKRIRRLREVREGILKAVAAHHHWMFPVASSSTQTWDLLSVH